MSPEDEELERLILERERLRASGAPGTEALEGAVAELTARRGLSPEEAEDVVAAVLAEQAQRGTEDLSGLRGAYRIAQPGRLLPYILVAALAAVVVGMGAPAVGVLLLACAASTFVLVPKGVTRFSVDDGGHLRLGSGARPLDWRRVAGLHVEVRSPSVGTEITRAARARLHVAFELNGGRRLRLARGQFFQEAPVRRPVHHVHVARFLRAEAERSGMTVVLSERGFTATRS